MDLKRFVKNLPDTKIDWRLAVCLLAAYVVEVLLWILLYDAMDSTRPADRSIIGVLHVQALLLAVMFCVQSLYVLTVALFGKLAVTLMKRDFSWSRLINFSLAGYFVSEAIEIACLAPLFVINVLNPRSLETAPLGTVLYLLNSPLMDLVAIMIFAWLISLSTPKKST
ncbi:MAG: hypothetical protein WC551_06450 [Patescibacteria group bacterium]